METGNRQQINLILRDFKNQQGVVKFDKVLAIPSKDRIPALAQNNFTKTSTIITAALTVSFESINLKRGMNALQIVDLAEAIIDSSAEDNLAMEDLMLFLQKLVRGEYGSMYESMDIPKFMTAFEEYREQRWQAVNQIIYEQSVQHKVQGDTGRTGEPDELSKHFSAMGERFSEMKGELKRTRLENNELKKNIL